MAEAAPVADNGTWRKGEFVRWTDLFIFIEAGLVWIGVIFVTAFLVAGVLIAMHYPANTLERNISGLAKNFVFLQAVMISYYLVLLYFLWRIARRVSTSSLVARYRALPPSKLALSALLGMALGVAVPLLNAWLIRKNVVDIQLTKGEQMMTATSLSQLPLILVTLALVAPFVEEMFFRGILLSWLKLKMPLVLAIVVSATVFALVHFDFLSHPGLGGWYITGVLAVVGLINAVLAIRTGSLWAPFGLHAAYNAMLIIPPSLSSALK